VTILGYTVRMDDDHLLPARRLVHLMELLERSDRKPRGAKKRAAEKLGLSESYASKLRNGAEVEVSEERLRMAAERFGVDLAYFTTPGPDDLDPNGYRVNEIGDPPGWEQWVASTESRFASDAEKQALHGMGLAAVGAGLSVTPGSYSAWLLALRVGAPAPTTH
jgi:transcriptional regulator with XRE-family HTH domain